MLETVLLFAGVAIGALLMAAIDRGILPQSFSARVVSYAYKRGVKEGMRAGLKLTDQIDGLPYPIRTGRARRGTETM